MKTMVKLTVLLATFLLLTSVAFAIDGACECYKVTYTNLDNPAFSLTEYDLVCLDYENNTGTFDGCDLSLFPGLITQGLVYGSPCCPAYFKFHGNDNNVITGEQHCLNRNTFWGHITDITHCR